LLLLFSGFIGCVLCIGLSVISRDRRDLRRITAAITQAKGTAAATQAMESMLTRALLSLFDTLEPFVEAEASLFNGDLSRALASILRTKCSFATGGPGKYRGDRRHLHHSAEALACSK